VTLRPHDEGGYATVWAVGWIAVLLLVSWVTLVLAVAVAHQHRLDGAADLAALSAADALQRGQDACAAANQVARANEASMTDCAINGGDVTVHVSSRLALPAGLAASIEAAARAGPSSDDEAISAPDGAGEVAGPG
jgi:secretion/DNA translocation related TadE-like protein